MEETEAMATLSKLPAEIIHYIFSFLPCIKDVVRSSLISKSWLQAWLTFPIPVFKFEDFVSPSISLSSKKGKAKTDQFIKFVNSSLQRFKKKNGDGTGTGVRMKFFNLSTVSEMFNHTNRCIGMALDIKVEHLSLRIVNNDHSTNLRWKIPVRVLSASWLMSLMLVGPTIYIPLTKDSRVDLPLLTSLYIESSNIPDEQLRKLLSGCPALEDIALLNCETLSKVDISDHPNLKTLEVTVSSYSANLTAITVKAPELKSFSYTCHCLQKRNVVVTVHNSPVLKHLRICDWNKSDEWFDEFIVQFPLIECLIIDWCNALRKIKIPNLLLESINITNCYYLEDVVIGSKKLASFLLVAMSLPIPSPSIRMEMKNPPNVCTAQISTPVFCDLLMEASWYSKLKEFLTRPAFKRLEITVQAVPTRYGDMMGEDVHKKLPPTACNIENLRLEVTAPSPCHSPILNGLLSACHPTSINLAVIPNNDFIQLVCEELGNRGNNRRCCCKDGFKCWKHQLKEVKIEKIKGIEMEEDLDWDGLFNRLPTLESGNNIYFKLTW